MEDRYKISLCKWSDLFRRLLLSVFRVSFSHYFDSFFPDEEIYVEMIKFFASLSRLTLFRFPPSLQLVLSHQQPFAFFVWTLIFVIG